MRIFSFILSLWLTLSAFGAYTERYVTVAGAGANDGTSEANAWTFAQMITAAPTGLTRVNIKSGSYSVGAYTTGVGSLAGQFVLRGYNSTPGDLDTPTYNTDGSLDTTDLPDITITAQWSPGNFSCFQNLDISGSINAPLIGTTGNDNIAIINCRMVNNNSSASARALQVDNNTTLLSSDFQCTGGTHASVVDMDSTIQITGCRFLTASSSACLTTEAGGSISGSVFYGNSGAIGVAFQATTGSILVTENTFYNLSIAIQFPNSVSTTVPSVINNYVTGCATFINSLYSGTAAYGAVVANNRIRDVTTQYVGIEPIEFGLVTTAGSDSDDYIDAGAGDFRLKATAPGVNAGMRSFRSMGAFQRDQSGSGGGQSAFAY